MLAVIGWTGASLLLIAFGLNVFKIIDANSKLYLILNLSGSALLLYSAFQINAFPFVVVNFVWIVFSLFRLIQTMKKLPT